VQIRRSFSEFLLALQAWHLPDDPKWLRAVIDGELRALQEMIENGLHVEARFDNKTMVEFAAMHARDDTIRYLFSLGAKLRNAMSIAETNAEFLVGIKQRCSC
jgi:hypothetical protein